MISHSKQVKHASDTSNIKEKTTGHINGGVSVLTIILLFSKHKGHKNGRVQCQLLSSVLSTFMGKTLPWSKLLISVAVPIS